MSWIGIIEKALGGIMDVMSAATFIQFIEEEAIQSAALGTFLALRHGSYRGAALAMNRTYDLCDNLQVLNDHIGWMAPYSKHCFEDFIAATRTNLEVYTDIITLKGKGKR